MSPWVGQQALMRAAIFSVVFLSACARVPYETHVLYRDSRAAVILQREVEPARYAHPIRLGAIELASILRGFSVRRQERLPLRWFAEERRPDRLFREDEITLLTPFIAEGLKKAGADERVHFALFTPGNNRSDGRTVTSGWMAIGEKHLYLTVEYLRADVPIHSVDQYFPNNPNLPPAPGSFLLFFEPGRYWVTDVNGARALEFREFLSTAPRDSPRP